MNNSVLEVDYHFYVDIIYRYSKRYTVSLLHIEQLQYVNYNQTYLFKVIEL